ncbi:MAG: TRAP transporter small permease [Betaproteobacteria bacterium]
MSQNHPLKRLARLCSVIGGVIMVALMLMTCYSVVGRNFFERALIGDFELTAIACGIAVAFFMPLCQIERGNIIVDFFTAGRSRQFNHRLDRIGDALMAVIFALLAWRTGVASIKAQENMGTSMLLGFPDWIVLAGMTIPFAVAAVIACSQAIERFKASEPEA